MQAGYALGLREDKPLRCELRPTTRLSGRARRGWLVSSRARQGRPGRAALPGRLCPCGQPAETALPPAAPSGRVTRGVDVPLCDDCQQEVRRLSGDEEAGGARLAGRGLAFLIFSWCSFSCCRLVSGGATFLLPLGVAALTAGASTPSSTATTCNTPGQEAGYPRRRPACGFSWRTMTLAFADEAYARQFADKRIPIDRR